MNAQQLKNSILQMAIQGKLVPQDPDDEPASVLIERIREEKEKLIKEKKIKKEKNPSFIFRGTDNITYEKIGKNEPISIEDELPFEIPESWEWVRLGNIFQIQMGQSPKGETVSTNQKGTEFHQGKAFFGDRYLTHSNQYTSAPSKYAPANSLLLCVRAPVGKVNITEREICIGRGLCSIAPMDNMPLLFVYHLFSFFERIFVMQSSGTTFAAITGEIVKNQLIPIPPLAEQQRIVDKLEEILPLVEAYGKKQDTLDKLNTNFPSSLKKSILQEAVQGKLVSQDPNDEPASVLLERIRAEKEKLIKEGKIKKDKNESIIYRRDNSHYEKLNGIERCIDDEIPFEIPESWCWVRLGSIGEWKSGATPSRSMSKYYDGDIPWLKTGDLNDGYIKYIPEKISQLALEKTSVKLNPIGSVLIAMYGATIGKLGILTFPSTTNQACCACLPVAMSNKYLFYFLMSQKDKFIKRSEGGAQPNISKEKIISTLMPLPPLAEQQRIVKLVEELQDIIKEL